MTEALPPGISTRSPTKNEVQPRTRDAQNEVEPRHEDSVRPSSNFPQLTNSQANSILDIMLKVVVLATIFCLFLVPNAVIADSEIVINEFLPDPVSGEGEWVELYFPSGSFDVSNYYLKDSSISGKKQLTNLQTCGSYVLYTLVNSKGEPYDGWLNNSGQESIYLYDGTDNLIDSFENWSNPGEGKTLGRIPDGSNNWQETQEPTRCGQNSQAIIPTPSPDPSPSPIQSSTVSTSTSAKSPSPSPSPSKSPSPSPKKSTEVLGTAQASSSADSPTPSPAPSASPQIKSQSKTKIAGMLTGSGAIIIGASIGFFLWQKKVYGKKEEKKDD